MSTTLSTQRDPPPRQPWHTRIVAEAAGCAAEWHMRPRSGAWLRPSSAVLLPPRIPTRETGAEEIQAEAT